MIINRKVSSLETWRTIFKGANYGVISQYIANMFVLGLLGDNETISNEIIDTNTQGYYAAVAAGIVTAYLSLYYDSYISNIIGIATYIYVGNIMNDLTGDSEYNINLDDAVIDIGAIVILITIFQPSIINDYYEHKYYGNIVPDSDLFSNILIGIVSTVFVTIE